MTAGMIFNIQRFSIQDGPGIRTTVFMKGCPLLCPWCSNPESQKSELELAFRASLCDDCGRCKERCEKGAISLLDKGIFIDRALCDKCFDCITCCAPSALKVIGDELSVDEVFEVVNRDYQYYRNSDGGVTASGGEPLAQPDFVTALFERCQAAGIHTTIDTSGAASQKVFEKVLSYTDLVLFDIKMLNATEHKRVIKTPNKRILENLKLLKLSGTPFIIRVPLIPALTDSNENIDEIAYYVLEELGGAPINVLPYHRFGTNKYTMLDMDYELPEMEGLSKERVNEVAERFQSFGLDCEIVI